MAINWIDNKWRVMILTKTSSSEKCVQRTYNDTMLLQKSLQISNPGSRVPMLIREEYLINLQKEDSDSVHNLKVGISQFVQEVLLDKFLSRSPCLREYLMNDDRESFKVARE